MVSAQYKDFHRFLIKLIIFTFTMCEYEHHIYNIHSLSSKYEKYIKIALTILSFYCDIVLLFDKTKKLIFFYLSSPRLPLLTLEEKTIINSLHCVLLKIFAMQS